MRLTLTLREPDGSILYEADLRTTIGMIDSARTVMAAALSGHPGAAQVIHDARAAVQDPRLPPCERSKSLVAMCMLFEDFQARRLGGWAPAPAGAVVSTEGQEVAEPPVEEGSEKKGACCRACELGGTCEKGPAS